MNSIQFPDDYSYYEIVIANIKKYRKKAGLTQEELAEMIGITHDYMTKIESKNTKKYFKLYIVGRIAVALNVDLYKFFQP